jgi:ribosome-binding factor A
LKHIVSLKHSENFRLGLSMSVRTERVASLLKEEVGTYITREYRDGSYGFITVTDVHITPDLRIAKFYVSIMGRQEIRDRTMKMLEVHIPEIRSFIGAHLRLKFTPKVNFYLDETLDRVEKIDRLIKQLHNDDPGKTRQ